MTVPAGSEPALPIGDWRFAILNPGKRSAEQSAIGNWLSEISSILIVKPSSLGDIVHTLPAAALVKQRWPAARLRWLINPEWAPLLEGNQNIAETIIFPRREFRGIRGALRIVPWARDLRARVKADLVLDFQGLLRSGLIAKLCCAERGSVVGLSDAREGARFFYDHSVPVSAEQHAVQRYLALVAVLGIDTEGPLAWPLPAGSSPAGFSAVEPFVLLHPFARGAGKSLSANDVAALFQALAPLPVVIAGRGDESLPPLANVIDLLNRTTLLELIWLIRRAAFIVSVDSGPMHIAAAITPRLLAIHTWSDPSKVGPYCPDAWIWKNGALFQQKHAANTAVHRPLSQIAELAVFIRQQLTG